MKDKEEIKTTREKIWKYKEKLRKRIEVFLFISSSKWNIPTTRTIIIYKGEPIWQFWMKDEKEDRASYSF